MAYDQWNGLSGRGAEGRVFCLGDNRLHSTDSASWRSGLCMRRISSEKWSSESIRLTESASLTKCLSGQIGGIIIDEKNHRLFIAAVLGNRGRSAYYRSISGYRGNG